MSAAEESAVSAENPVVEEEDKCRQESRKSLVEGNSSAPVFHSFDELKKCLEMLRDRCIARNLRAAGLSSFSCVEEDKTAFDACAVLATGESVLFAVLQRLADPQKQLYYLHILLSEGCDVNKPNEEGRSPVMVAVLNGYDKSAKLLLHSKKMNWAYQDQEGNTALHYIAAAGRESLLRFYLKSSRRNDAYGFKSRLQAIHENPFEIRNGLGETVAQTATRKGHPACVELLEEEAARVGRQLSRVLGLQQHSPSLARRSANTGRRLLRRIASLDNMVRSYDTPAAAGLAVAGPSRADSGALNLYRHLSVEKDESDCDRLLADNEDAGSGHADDDDDFVRPDMIDVTCENVSEVFGTADFQDEQNTLPSVSAADKPLVSSNNPSHRPKTRSLASSLDARRRGDRPLPAPPQPTSRKPMRTAGAECSRRKLSDRIRQFLGGSGSVESVNHKHSLTHHHGQQQQKQSIESQVNEAYEGSPPPPPLTPSTRLPSRRRSSTLSHGDMLTARRRLAAGMAPEASMFSSIAILPPIGPTQR